MTPADRRIMHGGVSGRHDLLVITMHIMRVELHAIGQADMRIVRIVRRPIRELLDAAAVFIS